MAEEPSRRGRGRPRGRRTSPKAAANGATIQWSQVEAALGPVRARQWRQELQEAAQRQMEAAQAVLASFKGAPTSESRPRRQNKRRTITDPVVLENRRAALTKAREALAARRRQENGEPADQDLTTSGWTG